MKCEGRVQIYIFINILMLRKWWLGRKLLLPLVVCPVTLSSSYTLLGIMYRLTE
jgi:hypothetical protein